MEPPDFHALLGLAARSPDEALPRLWEALRFAEASGNAALVHGTREVLVVLLIHYKRDLDRAEELALDLVDTLSDKVHLQLLGKVYRLLGRTTQERDAAAKAARADDLHDSERLRKLTESLHSSRRGSK